MRELFHECGPAHRTRQAGGVSSRVHFSATQDEPLSGEQDFRIYAA